MTGARPWCKLKATAQSTVLGVRSSWVTVKVHRLPSMSKRELDRALEFEVPGLFSFPIESPKDICYDYFINFRGEDEVEVVVAACARQHIEPFIRAFRELDLSLEVVDVPALGWPALLTQEGRRAFVEVGTSNHHPSAVWSALQSPHIVPSSPYHTRHQAFACSPQEAARSWQAGSRLPAGGGGQQRYRAAVRQFVGSVLQTLDFMRARRVNSGHAGVVLGRAGRTALWRAAGQVSCRHVPGPYGFIRVLVIPSQSSSAPLLQRWPWA